MLLDLENHQLDDRDAGQHPGLGRVQPDVRDHCVDLLAHEFGIDLQDAEDTNRVLGGSASARLFANLREDKGYTYGAYSRVSADLFPGVFAANTEVRNPVTDGSLHELMFELKRIRDEKVPAAELEAGRACGMAKLFLCKKRKSCKRFAC